MINAIASEEINYPIIILHFNIIDKLDARV